MLNEKTEAVKARVFKYEARVGAEGLAIEMPVGAEVLCVQLQQGVPQIWARVDPTAEPITRRFVWVGTGHPADRCGRYVGTVQAMDGALIFHLFEAA